MLTPDQKEEYDRLKEEVKPYYKYVHAASWINNSGFVIIGIGTLFLFFDFFIKTGFGLSFFLFSALWFFACFFVIDPIIGKLAKRNRISTDKMCLFLVLSAVMSFDRFFDKKISDTSNIKSLYFNKAKMHTEELLEIIEDKWVVGRFPLTAKIRDDVKAFKRLFSKHVIPNLDKRNEETLKEINDVLMQLSTFLQRPTIEHFELINQKMATLPKVSSNQETVFARIKKQPMTKWLIWTVGVTIIAFAMYWVGTNYASVSSDGAFLAATSAWAIGVFAIIPFSMRSSKKVGN